MNEPRKIDVFTNIYANGRVFEASMREFYERSLKSPSVELARHVAIDCHYPIDRDANAAKIREVCKTYGIKLLDSGSDRGLCGNFNFLWEQSHPHHDDVYFLGLDPDSNPGKQGWRQAMTAVLDASPDLGFLCLALSCTEPNIKSGYLKGKVVERAGYRVLIAESVDAMNVTMWRNSFWNKLHPLTAPRPYYGFVEGTICEALNRQSLKYGYLLDHPCGPCFSGLADPEYTVYKIMHVSGFVLCSMEAWLKSARFLDTIRDFVRKCAPNACNDVYVRLALLVLEKHCTANEDELLTHVETVSHDKGALAVCKRLRERYA